MKLKKSPAQLIARFEMAAPGPPAQSRKMFGYPCAFVNGNLFMGLFADGMFVRLPEAERTGLVALGGKQFAPMGRSMKDYIVLPAAIIDDDARLKSWVARSLEFGQTIVPKKQPARAPKRRRKSPPDR